MTDRALFRWGGMAAVFGAILLVIFNLLHPRPTDFDNAAGGELRLVADSDAWVPIHLGILLGSLLIILGLFALARSMKGTSAEGLSRLALGSLLIAAPVSVLTLAVDGYGLKAAADAAAGGQAGAVAAGMAVAEVTWGLFMFLILTFLGITPVFFGMAIAASRTYPAGLGWVAVVFGLVSVFASVWGTLAGPTQPFFLVFTVSSLVLTLFVLVAGLYLYRRAREAERVPA
jgi:hypothetical protein